MNSFKLSIFATAVAALLSALAIFRFTDVSSAESDFDVFFHIGDGLSNPAFMHVFAVAVFCIILLAVLLAIRYKNGED